MGAPLEYTILNPLGNRPGTAVLLFKGRRVREGERLSRDELLEELGEEALERLVKEGWFEPVK